MSTAPSGLPPCPSPNTGIYACPGYQPPELDKDRQTCSGIYVNLMEMLCVKPDLRTNAVLVTAAVRQNGLALAYADPSLINDIEIVKIAVSQNGRALAFSGELMRDNDEVVALAVLQDPKAIMYASDRLRLQYYDRS